MVSVTYIGFETQSRSIVIKPDETVREDFSLSGKVLDSEPLVVTGSPSAVDPLQSPQDVQALSGLKKIRFQSALLGRTVEAIPGIYNMSAGAVAGNRSFAVIPASASAS